MGLVSPSARTLKVLDLTVSLHTSASSPTPPLAELCQELEAMAGRNILEALFLKVCVGDQLENEDFIGYKISRIGEGGTSTLITFSYLVLSGHRPERTKF